MDEKLIKKYLRKLTVIFMIVCLVLIMVGYAFSKMLHTMFTQELSQQMVTEVKEYQAALNREMETNLKVLSVIAGFMEMEDVFQKEEAGQWLSGECKENDFLKIGYWKRNGEGIQILADGTVQSGLSAKEQDAQVYESIETAWKGEKTTSELYGGRGDTSGFFSSSVPVFQSGKVVGALTACHSSASLLEALQDMAGVESYGNLYLIDREYRVMPSSEKKSGEFTLSSQEKERLHRAVRERETLFFQVEGKEGQYRAYMEPTKIQSWYFIFLSPVQKSSHPFYQNMWLTRIILCVILFFSMAYLFIGYRMIQKKNREILKVSYTDVLTGAGNMADFTRRLEEAFQTQKEFSVLALNVRKFKFINEIFGDVMANRFLCDMKMVLDHSMEQGEFFCRETADKFYIFLKTADKELIRRRFEGIVEKIRERFQEYHKEYTIMVYGGGVTTDEVTGKQLKKEEVMTHVMFALNRARNSQTGELWFYNTELHQSEILRNYVESHMDQALKEGEFKLFLQPQKDLKKGKLGGAEALVRWVTPNGKMIYPDQFIPLFEKNGFCSELDMYMVELVCRQIREWMDAGKEVIPVAVNQSKLAFYKENYVERLESIIRKYQIPAELITLEILEGIMLGDTRELNGRITELKEKGFKISMDDFGSGYSSLNILSSLDIDELKLDRVFLLKMSGERKEKQQVVMEQIVQLAEKMHIVTVAEGVETKEQEAFILQAGCDYGQGYYYSRPVSAEEFTRKILGHPL